MGRFIKKMRIDTTEDTIAAISTSAAPSGIGIVRISGKDAFAVADRLYRGVKNKKLADQKGNTVHYGWIVHEGKKLDEVLCIVLRAPHSYTGDDTVEIDCHGGVIAVRRVLEAALAEGARIAEPGEFTKRAFLNGRIDMSQAEAVMDVISAKSEYALESSLSQLSGSLKDKISRIREALLYELAYIESALDDPEHYDLDGYTERISGVVSRQKEEIEKLIASFDKGKFIGEGIKTVILGKPNAGKSSLLNAVTGKQRAIVTDIPGTTRDVIEETIQLSGIALRILDTAGIRSADNEVERIGVDMAKSNADDADLILYVYDGTGSLDENDREILSLIRGKKAIILVNKTDLEDFKIPEALENREDFPVIAVSAKTGEGLDTLKETITKLFFEGSLSFNEEVVITNLRHRNALFSAEESLENVEESIANGMPEDFLSIDLYGALDALDMILGGNLSEDLVDEIFSKFCTGK